MKSILLSVFLVLFSVSAFADRAIVIDGNLCGGFVPNEDGSMGENISTLESHAVLTDEGQLKVTCHFDHVADIPYAYSAEGFDCVESQLELIAVKTKMVAMPSGRAMLLCKFVVDE
jgi:hypothetical protein